MYNLFQYHNKDQENQELNKNNNNNSTDTTTNMTLSQELAADELQKEQLVKYIPQGIQMLYIGFNQINSLLCVGTQRGFHVFSTNNYTQKTFHCKSQHTFFDIYHHREQQ